ncbi:hypothetical protein HOC35_04635 [Candidatus Woesearchaeota archaeon]|jgi:acyl-CoA thioesterase I|nr:hypothetical protein [Candidatus Woesearchaeota archaeon]
MEGILCFGASITFGRGEIPNKGWCGRLKDYFEVKGSHNSVYNLGVPGQTTTDLLDRFDAEAKARIRMIRPNDKYLIIIAIGTNDCKWDYRHEKDNIRVSDEDFRKNIQLLITKAKSYDAKFAIFGLSPVDESKTGPFEETFFKNERVKLFNSIIKEVCEENNVLFLDMFNIMIKEDYPNLLEDGLHPNSAGFDFMFENIKGFLEKNELI